MINLHVTITVPKGKFHPRFKDVPAVDSFAKTDMDRRDQGLTFYHHRVLH